MDQSLKPLPWHEPLWVELTGLVQQQRLPHALLLAGPRGVGKRAFARALAAFVLCERRTTQACGSCRSCEQFLAATQPNFHVLQPEVDEKTGRQKREIVIGQVRALIGRLVLTSHYGQAKLAVIEPADALNVASANALLKTIEEPPPGTHLLLISEQPQALLATVRSRCRKVRFGVPPPAQAQEWLAQSHPHDAEVALAAARGAPILAREWIEAREFERRREWQDAVHGLAQGKRDPLAVAAGVAREDADTFLEWLLGWLGERLREAARGGGVFGGAALNTLAEEVAEARRKLDENNANAQLTLEAVLILLWRLARDPARAA